MFTVHTRTDSAVTFHFDATNETPRRWHAVPNCAGGRWGFVTDMCGTKARKPGIPTDLRGKTFTTAEETVAAVLALNA